MSGEPYPVLTEVGANQPRELHCQLCDREHPVWFAPNEVWNAVMRWPDGREESEHLPFVCPTCFIKLAEAHGIVPTAWVVAPESLLDALRAALPDPFKLRLLADWLDRYDQKNGERRDEVQRDLRAWADAAEAATS